MRVWKKLLVVALAIAVLSGIVGTAMAMELVSIAEAKEVAKKFIFRISDDKEFREWKGVKLSSPIVCYDINDNPTAYLFELKKDGKYLGYIVVSATKDNYPILEFSKGKSPLMRASELGIKPEKVYYLGGVTYFFKQHGKYYDLFGNGVNFKIIKQGVKELLKDEKVKKHLAKRSAEAKSQWKFIEETAKLDSDWYGIHIQGVPALLWHRGCTPTAAAMVLGYWDQHGYPKFPDNYTKLIDELADAMGTWDNGYTPQWQVSSGINTICRKYGYSDWASDVWWVTWDMVTGEISKYRPFVLTMVLHPEYTWHSVTVIGYAIDINTNSKYILLYNTWDTDVHYTAFGSWLGANAHKVVPT